ncbi:hypothetical protein F5878DRAFT_652852 [Lentinula raphanica]|uniref:Protein Zds1 C-terminal domain-containing protein n=1 Tax=Lentinula raphanica TaxID=153919 RepID=A0AA38UC46_9AGAR|nr:hypothetical protein F5878DRAFT_652852 [Lentinula raphanica]
MQPSTYDIQREVEALRDIRRRSTTPGALTIDPDLPNQTSPSSPTYSWSGGSTTDDSSSSSHEDGSSSSTGHTTVESTNPADDPFHLFWVPASVHPEIAPAEFREFLREHSRSPPPADGTPVSRSGSFSSLSSGGLGRKKSMLSRQYKPSENDGVEEQEERIVPLSRTRSTRYTNQGPQLTISDLQKLEQLAEEASESDDPSKLRNILRRSLSLNISPTAIEQMKNMPDMGDEADAPIIIPPRSQILRRTNRTKIRKPALPGDGGGHRFGASRRGGRSATAAATAATANMSSERTSSDHSSSDHEPDARPRLLSNEFPTGRPDSFSEESLIYDAYVNEEEESHPSPLVATTSPPPQEEVTEAPRVSLQQTPIPAIPPVPVSAPVQPIPSTDVQPMPAQPTPDSTVLHQPQPQRLLSPQVTSDLSPPSRTPSPPSSPMTEPPAAPPAFLSSPPPPHHHRKEKDKKGLFGKWGSDKSGKKAKDHNRTESAEKDKDKDSGFFGSLFGGKKSKDSDGSAPSTSAHGHTAGREAAQALLGASKSSKNYQPPPSPGAQAINNYSRYPIHVERAIYRLSHIKLANPRRPLYEQVLISNLMFWYLGVINKAQNPQANAAGQTATGGAAAPTDKEQQEKEQREAEQREKERQEQERQERELREREREMESKKQKEASPKRGPLTKPAPMGTGGGRRAEMPIRGPQYEMQHREMEQAYGGYPGYNGGSTQQQNMVQGRRSPGTGQRAPSSPQSAPRLVQPADSQTADNFYYPPDSMAMNQPPPQSTQQQRLPPGAMPPMEKSTWSTPGSPRQSNSSSPPLGSSPDRRSSRSPPNAYSPQGMYGNNMSAVGGRTPSRSLSATAVPSPSSSPPNMNGRIRKGVSAHAVPSKARSKTPESTMLAYQTNGGAEEEDVPLAVWQQQRKR